jgi:hypothetical protein
VQGDSECLHLCGGQSLHPGAIPPRLIIYNRKGKEFREVDYPTRKPDVWYGTEAIDGKLYLFDRVSGIIRWDTRTDEGELIGYPYDTPMPASGRYDPVSKSLWCFVWDFTAGKYLPRGLARLDIEKGKFSDWFEFPRKDSGLEEYTDADSTLFLPHTLQGRLVPFDLKRKQWRRPIDVPDHGKRFGFLGGPVSHAGRLYFSLSTYNGTDTGCDGEPYHFLNAILEFDPTAKKFEFRTLEAERGYYQIAYMHSAGGEFYATGTNIREPDGNLNRDRAGEVVFWQTRRPTR